MRHSGELGAKEVDFDLWNALRKAHEQYAFCLQIIKLHILYNVTFRPKKL